MYGVLEVLFIENDMDGRPIATWTRVLPDTMGPPEALEYVNNYIAEATSLKIIVTCLILDHHGDIPEEWWPQSTKVLEVEP